MATYMSRLTKASELFRGENSFCGMETTIPSHDDLGLQLVDLFVGEVRELFRKNPEFLTEGATLKLIRVGSNEPIQSFMKIGDHFSKLGSLTPMSTILRSKISRRNAANPISYYYPVLASGILTCMTTTGQYRFLEIPTRSIFDALD
jgi:hypothetical protein